jgi:hypothetical protein
MDNLGSAATLVGTREQLYTVRAPVCYLTTHTTFYLFMYFVVLTNFTSLKRKERRFMNSLGCTSMCNYSFLVSEVKFIFALDYTPSVASVSVENP